MATGLFPTVDEYKEWARLSDTQDDTAIGQALEAVQLAILERCPRLVDMGTVPEDIYYASLLWTNRLMSRRNSPDGIVGVADLGIATISRFDKDIAQMLSPYVAVVLA